MSEVTPGISVSEVTPGISVSVCDQHKCLEAHATERREDTGKIQDRLLRRGQIDWKQKVIYMAFIIFGD